MMEFHPNHLSQDLPPHHFPDQQQQQQTNQIPETTAPNWLNTALLRSQPPQPPQPNAHFSDPNFLNLHTTIYASGQSTSAPQAPNQWVSRSSSSLLQRNHSDVMDDMEAIATAGGGLGGRQSMVESGELKSNNSESMNNNNKSKGVAEEIRGGGDGAITWQIAEEINYMPGEMRLLLWL